MLRRLRSLPDRWPWLGVAVGTQKRFGEVRGGYLASAVTLAAFTSLFPLLLVGIAAVGFFSSGGTDVTDDAIELLGLSESGTAVEQIRTAVEKAEESKEAASIVGLAGLLWSGLGLVAALQHTFNSVWQVRGRGWKDKIFGLGWLLGAALLFVASFAVTTVLQVLPAGMLPINIVAGLLVGVGLFLWSARVLAHRDVGWRPLLPGAILGAVGFEVLKVVGGIYVPRAVASSSALYGSIGVVFAILAWLFFFGRLVVYVAVLNVVLWERHHGTVSVQVEAPHVPGEVPLEADRSGLVHDRERAAG